MDDQQITETSEQIEEQYKNMDEEDSSPKKQTEETQLGSEKEDSEEDISENEMLSNNKSFILRKYKCRACNKKFGGKKSYYEHECQLDELKCRFCQKEFKKSNGNSQIRYTRLKFVLLFPISYRVEGSREYETS